MDFRKDGVKPDTGNLPSSSGTARFFLFTFTFLLSLPHSLYIHFEVSFMNIVSTKQDGTDRSLLGRKRPWVSMGRPVLPPEKLEQLPGLVKPASYARLS